MKKFLYRTVRAFRLDPELYAQVANDATTNGHAVWMVAIFSMSTAFGLFSRGGPSAINSCLVTTLLSWYVWAFTVSYAGTRLMAPGADRKSVMRVMAFACAPGFLRLLGVIPQLTFLIFVCSSIWMITASIIGVKKALNISDTLRVAGICTVTWLLSTFMQAISLVILYSVFGISKTMP